MGNQAGSPSGKFSSRFTLRGLSWRPPRNAAQPNYPAIPGEDFPANSPYEGADGFGQQNQKQNVWDDDEGEWDEESRASRTRSMMQSEQYTMDSRAGGPAGMRPASTLPRGNYEASTMGTQRDFPQETLQSEASAWSDEDDDPADHGPEFKELYDKLVAFYLKHDPDAINNDEIDISGMTSWCLESEEGSLEELNDKLYERFGESLEDFDGAGGAGGDEYDDYDDEYDEYDDATLNQGTLASGYGQSTMGGGYGQATMGYDDGTMFSERSENDTDEWETGTSRLPSMAPAARVASRRVPSMAPSQAGGSTEDAGEIRDQLERFFLQYEPEALGDIDEYLDEFAQHGKMALNVKLFRAYGKNLTTLEQGDSGNRSSVQPESMGMGMGGGNVRASRKASKFGVATASSGMLDELHRSKAMTRPRKPNGFPDFTRRRNDLMSAKKHSNVSDSLQRRWDHLANRNKGVSTRISTRVSKNLERVRTAETPAVAPQPPKNVVRAQSIRTAPKPTNLSSNVPKPRGMRGSVKDVAVFANKAPVNLKTGKSAASGSSSGSGRGSRVRSRDMPMATMPKKKDNDICPRFQINLAGEFGTCKNCGRKKEDHFVRRGPKLAPTLARRWDKINAQSA